jgi:HlyD family secretion protein
VRNRIIFGLAILGVVLGIVAAIVFGIERKPQPPLFKPAESPFASAIFANGIIESDQASGSNVNVYPEVSGTVTAVAVRDGQAVVAGAVLLTLDDSVQQATTRQLGAQAEAALALLEELKAEPRRETLAIALAQVALAGSNLKAARDQYDKDRAAFDADPHSISRSTLDVAADAVLQGSAADEVARRQYELTRAGAWRYDIANQQKTYEALRAASDSARALLAKFTLRAHADGVVLALNATPGGYVSPAGVYDTYTQAEDPVLVIGPPQAYLAVRCFVDEILVAKLPNAWHIRAEMAIRGSDIRVPLEFVRVQPYVTPKIELSDERQEQVDLRVLPVIFRFPKQDAPVYPGQEVDVYIGRQ